VHPAPSTEFCSKFFRAQNVCIAAQTITTHVNLELRLYAMYGRKKKILAVLVSLISAEAIVMGVLFGMTRTNLIATNNPAEGVWICADGDPLNGTHWIMFYWVALLFLESCLLSLALYQAWMHRNNVNSGGLLRAFSRDSVLYFIMIFWVYLANLVFWARNRVTLDEVGTSYSLVISIILANRLMIGVRKTYYQSEATMADGTTTVAFNTISLNSDYRYALESETAIEMDGFDARHGY